MGIKISVTTLSGETTTLNVEASDHIHNVKAKIQDTVNLLWYEMELIFENQPLENGKTISYYNIQKEALLTLVLMNYGAANY